MGNKAYYANRQLVNSSLISRSSKLQIYRTLVRPVVTYGSESWTLTMEDESISSIWKENTVENIWASERKRIMRIWQNNELEAIIKGENIVGFIKWQRIRWLGHIERMQHTAIPKKILYGKL